MENVWLKVVVSLQVQGLKIARLQSFENEGKGKRN